MIRALQKPLLALVTVGVLLFCTFASAQQLGRTKPIKVGLRVEAEGPQGLWMQSGKDLSSAELNQLRSLITAEIAKLSNHKLVSSDEKDDHLGLVLVAEKLQSGRKTYILLSSVLVVAKADGKDLLVTHDVIAAPSLALAAAAVVGYLAGAEFRGMFGSR